MRHNLRMPKQPPAEGTTLHASQDMSEEKAAAPDPERWRTEWAEIGNIAREAGRDPAQLTGAVYLTLTIDEDKARAEERMNAFIQNYYGRPAAEMRARQATFAGPAEGAAEWLSSWARAGASHLVLRFAGDHQRHLEAISRLRASITG